jgi:hypothetical protein
MIGTAHVDSFRGDEIDVDSFVIDALMLACAVDLLLIVVL